MRLLSIAAAISASLLVPTSAAAQQSTPPAAAFIGDSIGYDALAEITQEVSRSRPLTVGAAVRGANIRNALPLVRELVARPDAPAIWVIELGHVDTSLNFSMVRIRSNIRAMLDTLAPQVACVRWLDVTEERGFFRGLNARAGTFNSLLRSMAREYDNVEVMPYSAWTSLAPPSDFIADNVHHTVHGQREMGRIVRQAADGCDPATNSGPYWDVTNTHPAAGAIAWVGERHLTRSYSDGTFRAQLGSITVPATRGTVAFAAWRRAGAPRGYGPPRWSDSPPWLRPAFGWVDHEHLDPGADGSRYRPGAVSTRAHAITFLWRIAGSPRVLGSQPWDDAPVDLRAALRWLVSTGHRSVFPGDSIGPTRALSRAQLAQLMAPPTVIPPGP